MAEEIVLKYPHLPSQESLERQEFLPLKVRFLINLARCLHQYGASAYRLEGAVTSVSAGLRLHSDLFCGPTSCFLTIRDVEEGDDSFGITTRVLRLQPGDVHLARLTLASDIADRVVAGSLDVREGIRLLRNIEKDIPSGSTFLSILAYSMTGGGAASLVGGHLGDILAATIVGALIGIIANFPGRLQAQGAVDAVCAMVAALCMAPLGTLIPELNQERVVIAGLIVLMPGLGLTTAMAELATQHLVSGSARLAGSFITLLKLTFGVVLGTRLGELWHLEAASGQSVDAPAWLILLTLPVAAWGFSYLFRPHRRDLFAAILSAIFSYVLSTWSTSYFGPEFGIFVAGFAVAFTGNLYARILKKPASIWRLPGLILLVPGSVGFRGVNLAFEKDVLMGLDTGFALMVILISLVAGLLFGNVAMPPRHSL